MVRRTGTGLEIIKPERRIFSMFNDNSLAYEMLTTCQAFFSSSFINSFNSHNNPMRPIY